jgi:hypothetical protein
MTYKFLYNNLEGQGIYAKVDDDGISRSSCSEHNPEFQAWLAEGNEPLPADEPPAAE